MGAEHVNPETLAAMQRLIETFPGDPEERAVSIMSAGLLLYRSTVGDQRAILFLRGAADYFEQQLAPDSRRPSLKLVHSAEVAR